MVRRFLIYLYGKKIKNFLEKEKIIKYKNIFKYIQIFYLIKTFKMKAK